MNIIVRNMVRSDIEDLCRALAAQGWLMPSSVFERHYCCSLRGNVEVLVAETRGEPAGFLRIEWLDAGEECGHAYAPEIKEFIVLEKYTGAGVAEAMIAEAERRVEYRTGGATENALMAVYCANYTRLPFRCSYVLDGLLVSREGKFIRSRGGRVDAGGAVISMARARK